MSASYFEFHVEEPSLEAFLAAWLPRTLPENCIFNIHPYQGKNALLRKIEDRLKGYATCLPDEYRIVVIVDLDGDKCKELKSKLELICKSAGLRSRRIVGGLGWQAVTRIAIEELEAWYFGDWQAVCQAYPTPLPRSRRNHGRHMGGLRTSSEKTRCFKIGNTTPNFFQ